MDLSYYYYLSTCIGHVFGIRFVKTDRRDTTLRSMSFAFAIAVGFAVRYESSKIISDVISRFVIAGGGE